MKTKFIIYFTVLQIIILGTMSCSNDDEISGDKQSVSNSDAILYEFSNQTFTHKLDIELSTLELEVTDSINLLDRLTLVYYTTEKNPDTWHSVPDKSPAKDYRLQWSLGENETDPGNYNLEIKAQRADDNKPYDISLSYDKIRVISVDFSVAGNITPKDLDTRDYNAVINYFGLEQ
ncbi:hypothetical protein LS482_02185 [Sinomicrobium kalidii]|uniref:hypothetical protein n=1 Tax=Sinomicrobium kalidii TaxID=2900738 RepID=UPI001E43688A|nr:hypothetical protein [Sinomicrobium kalidii]UGU16690.1 hypothetical protein LS482_02185 [Sinomicrobium kalidii]